MLPPAAELVPHRGAALLLERIDAAGAEGLTATVRVPPHTALATQAGALPGWAGAEIMAQAISAFATLRAGPPFQPRPGLLLGVRHYRGPAEFPAGAALRVLVRESTRDAEGRAVFDCRIDADDRPLADGTLTVYQPDDAREALREQLE